MRGICPICFELEEDCMCGQFKIKARAQATVRVKRAVTTEDTHNKSYVKSKPKARASRRKKGKHHGVSTPVPGLSSTEITKIG